jgi:uncharacterized membrane protein
MGFQAPRKGAQNHHRWKPLVLFLSEDNMIRRTINLITILTLLITFPLSYRGNAEGITSLSTEAVNIPAGIRLLHSDSSGVVMELNVPIYELVNEYHNEESVQKIILEDAGKTAEIGKPELPVYSALIGLPADAQITLQIVSAVSETPSGQYKIIPVPRAEFLQPEAKSGDYIYERDVTAYSEDSYYPSAPVKIADDAWLRDQRVVRIEFYPFQYNPMRGSLLWHRQLTIQVQFAGDTTARVPVDTGVIKDDAFGSILQELVLNYDVARAWRGVPWAEIYAPGLSAQDSAATVYEPVFLGSRYKIVVDHDGLYRLTYEALQQIHPLENDDPNTFHMYNQGRDVAIHVDDGGDGVFNNNDSVYFFGEQFRGDYMAQRYSTESTQWMTFTQQLTDGSLVPWHPEFDHYILEKYTDQNVYWLTVGGTGGPRMAEFNGDPSGSTAPIPSTYQATIHAERELRHWESSFTTTDSWYWDYATDFTTHIYTTTLTGIAPGVFTATVRGEVMAYKYNTAYSPDHHTRFLLNNRIDPIDDAYWDGKSRYHFDVQVPQSDLVEGTNQLKFQNINDAYANPPYIAFDFFEIDYTRLYQAEQNKLIFPGDVAGTWRYQVGRFTTSELDVFDVTDPVSPIRIINPSVISAGGTYSATFLVTHDAGERYFVAGGYESPDILNYYQPPDFGSITLGVDYLFIAHSEFITATQTLANFWTSRGLTTMVVNVDDLYAEFNDGIFHSLAIKNFIAYAFAHWYNPPTYVLLIGDGTWDIKISNPALYGSNTIYMPPHLSWVDPWTAETDSPNLLATVVGDDILPDVLIGRLPVSSSTELSNIITKITTYMQSPREAWQRNLLFIADDTPDQAGDFVSQSESIINEFVRPGFDAVRIYLDDYKDNNRCGAQPFPYGPTCTPVNRAITETVSITGTAFVNYAGHGSVQYWTSDKILVYQEDNPAVPNDFALNDIASMSNGNMLPVVLSMTCWDGYWYYPAIFGKTPSLSEVWLNTGGRGAIAVFSSAGLGIEYGHLTLQEGFYQAVFDDGIWNLGLATLAGKLNLYRYGTSLDLINTYITFGDPALQILSPYQIGMSPDSREGTAAPGESVTYTFQVTNQGAISDTISLSIMNNNWPADFPLTIGPLPAGESQSFDVTVNIPADADGDATDTATFVVTSLGDRSQTDSASLITHSRPVYGVQVDPASASQYSQPGSAVIYNLQVTNTGNFTDSFMIHLGHFHWPVSAPAVIGPAARDESIVLPITVNIPVGAEDWDSDSVNVRVFSQSDASQSASAQLTTVARTYGVSFTPPTSSLEGAQGTTVTYTLQLNNFGGYMDTFTVTIDSEWPARVIPNIVGPVNPGQSASLNVAVDIPTGLPGGSYDEAVVTATSWGDSNRTGQATLRTIGTIYGLLVRPAYAAQAALPGSRVTYTLQITNTSNIIDSYNVTSGSHNWPLTLSDSTIGPLDADGGSTTLTATVDIPPSAQEWSADKVVIEISSQTVPDRIAIATLVTTARLHGVMVTPAEMADEGFPGTRVIYPLRVINTGGFPDTFTVTAVGGWPVEVNSSQVGPLEANQAEKITVTVDIPADAGDAIDITNLVVTSWGNPEVSDQSILTTTSRLYGVALDTDMLSILGSPGEDVVYELQVTNTSNYSDIFTVQINSSWFTFVEPVWIGPLPAHASANLVVVVSIPVDAEKGRSSVADVVVTSLTDDRKQAVAYLTTYVEWGWLYLPLVQK